MTDKTVAELMALADDYELLGSTLSRARLEQAIRRAVDSSLEAAKQEPLPLSVQFSADYLRAYMEGEPQEARRHLDKLIAALAAAPSPGSGT